MIPLQKGPPRDMYLTIRNRTNGETVAHRVA